MGVEARFDDVREHSANRVPKGLMIVREDGAVGCLEHRFSSLSSQKSWRWAPFWQAYVNPSAGLPGAAFRARHASVRLGRKGPCRTAFFKRACERVRRR